MHLAEPLQADVVAAPLEHRPVEVVRQRRGEERQVLAGELVLQRLGGRGDDDTRAAGDRRQEVGERLARARARLHDEVPSGIDGLGDELGHPLLAGAVLGLGEVGRDVGELHAVSFRAASSSAASNSGQVLSVKWMALPALCQRRKLDTRCSPDVRMSTSTGGSSGR